MHPGRRAADPAQQPVLFVNPRSGGGKAARAGLAERARERGIEVIVLRPDDVSLGVYGDAVRQPTYRDAKARTLLATAAHVLGPSGAAADLQLVDDRGRTYRNPAVVLVSNNPYSLKPSGATGARPTLSSGQLGVIALDRPVGAGSSPGRTWTATQLEVDAPAPVHAGVDGEAVDLGSPLRFVIRPGALRVRIASRHATG